MKNRRQSRSRTALCIGINDYPGTGSDLSGCVNDANDWAAVLKARGYAVTTILDAQATGVRIRKAIDSLLAGTKSGDSVVVQYSGHGSYVPDDSGDEPDGRDECLCPYDVASKGYLTDDELFTLFSSRNPDSRLVFISDYCHSGSVLRFVPIRTPPTLVGPHPPTRTVRFLPPQTFLSNSDFKRLGNSRAIRRSSPPGRYAGLLMAGCQDNEYSYDAMFNGRSNGAFSFVAMRALNSLGANAAYLDWYRKIRKVLPSRQYAQTPNLYGSAAMRAWPVLS